MLRPRSATDDGQAYGFRAAFGAGLSCEREAIDQLVDLQRNALAYARRDGLLAEDELFYAEQNAQVVRDAERYYRAMFGGRVTSWNLRDQHMAHTLDALLAHLDGQLRTRQRESLCGRTTLMSVMLGRRKCRPTVS